MICCARDNRLCSGWHYCQAQAFVYASLALVSYNPNMADLAGTRDMCATIGLNIQPDYLGYAHYLNTFGQQIDLCANQVRDGEGCGARQETDAHLAVRLNLGIHASFYLGGEVERHALKLKILARFARLHCAARDVRTVVAPDDAAEDMECCVSAHKGVAALPIEFSMYLRPHRGNWPLQPVPDLVTFTTHIAHPRLPARPGERAVVSRLSSAPRIKDRLVQHNPIFGDAYHRCIHFTEVAVSMIELIGVHKNQITSFPLRCFLAPAALAGNRLLCGKMRCAHFATQQPVSTMRQRLIAR